MEKNLNKDSRNFSNNKIENIDKLRFNTSIISESKLIFNSENHPKMIILGKKHQGSTNILEDSEVNPLQCKIASDTKKKPLFSIRRKSQFTNRVYNNQQRFSNKEYIIKKIKLLFFNNYCKKYVLKFFKALQKHRKDLVGDEELIYYKLNYDFIKNISQKKNREWNLQSKSILEIYSEFSKSNLKKVVDCFLDDKNKFKRSLKRTEAKTKAFSLSPLVDVYNDLLKDEKEFEKFVDRVKFSFFKGKAYNNCVEDFGFLTRNFLNIILGI